MHWSDEQCRSFLILNDLTLNTIKYVLQCEINQTPHYAQNIQNEDHRWH